MAHYIIVLARLNDYPIIPKESQAPVGVFLRNKENWGCLKSWLFFRHPREFKIKPLYNNDLILNIALKSKEIGAVQEVLFYYRLYSPYFPRSCSIFSFFDYFDG